MATKAARKKDASRAQALSIDLRLKHVVMFAYILMMLPSVLFLLGWLQLWWGIPGAALLIFGLVWLYRKDYASDARSVHVPVLHILGAAALFGFVVALLGVAGVGVSGFDIPWRNAIFHDLVDYSWPIIYENGNAMVYYCAFWLPAALVGKLAGWGGALFALWLNIVLIMLAVYLLLVCILHIETPKRMWMVACFIVLWGGLQHPAAAISTMMGWNIYDYPILSDGSAYWDKLYNGEAFNWYYRTNYMTLQMTYNQLLIWLAVPLALAKRKAGHYMFLGLLVLPCSPWGFIGLIPLLVVAAIPSFKQAYANNRMKGVVKEILSPANIAALVVLVPMFALYFLASSKTGGTTSPTYVTPDQVQAAIAAGQPYTTQTGSFGFLSFDRFTPRLVSYLVFFWVMEFGIYLFLVYPKYRKKPLYWCVLVVLMVVPLMWAGTINGRDFCMNASIPGLILVMVFVLRYMNENVCGKPFGLRSACVVIALILAFSGPVLGMMNRAKILKSEHTLSMVDDHIGTLSDKPMEDYSNFLIDNPDDVAFYKYLARR